MFRGAVHPALGIAVQSSPHSRPNASSYSISLLSALNSPLGPSRWSSPLGWPSLEVTFTSQQHHMSPTIGQTGLCHGPSLSPAAISPSVSLPMLLPSPDNACLVPHTKLHGPTATCFLIPCGTLRFRRATRVRKRPTHPLVHLCCSQQPSAQLGNLIPFNPHRDLRGGTITPVLQMQKQRLQEENPCSLHA